MWRSVSIRCYTSPVTSKKGVIGIGVLTQTYDESRSTSACHAAFSFVPQVLAARWEGRKARRVSARFDRYANLIELPPRLASKAVVL